MTDTLITANKGNAQPSRAWQIILGIGIVVGIVLRLVLRGNTSLWEDEVIAATHAMQPIVRLITNVIMNDVHPPLYFMELHFWSALGTSDAWLIANSLLFSLLAIISVYVVARKLSNTTTALTAAAVMATLPAAIWMAQEVRMYAMLSVLLIWMMYFTHVTYSGAKNGLRYHLAVLALGSVIAYTHAIGFIGVFFFGIYAATLLLTRKATFRNWLSWALVFGTVGVMVIPLLLGGLLHKADMAPLTGLNDIISWAGSVITGEGYRYNAALRLAGAIVYAVIVSIGVWMPQTRRLTLCFLVLPLLFCAAVGLMVKPIFKTNFFSTFFSPFLAFVVAGILTSLPFTGRVRTLMLSIALMVFLLLGFTNRLTLNGVNNYYKPAVDVITSEKQAGDVVWVPQMSVFWGIAWYMAGAHWGNPVTVSEPFREGSGWWKLFDRMGPDLVRKLDLLPERQMITTPDGTQMFIGLKSEPTVTQAKRVWLVTFAPRNDVPADMPGDKLDTLHRVETHNYTQIQLNLYAQ